MLVLTRKSDEQILIGDQIKITLVRVQGNSVRIGIDAPRDIRIIRGELAVDDSKEQEASEYELSDREQVFAHPQRLILSGRVKVPAAPNSGPVAESSTAIERASKPEQTVGEVARRESDVKTARAPLAAFVSAT